jgi:hypothetical protein
MSFPVLAISASDSCTYTGAPVAVRLLGEPGVVGVRVGEQHRVKVLESGAERRHRAAEQIPVFRRPGVHQDELSRLPDHVEVRDACRQAMNPVGYFHVITFSCCSGHPRCGC